MKTDQKSMHDTKGNKRIMATLSGFIKNVGNLYKTASFSFCSETGMTAVM